MSSPQATKELPRIRNVFVSSTHRDLKAYRREVKDALSTAAQVEAFLSEDWIHGYQDPVKICHDLVYDADGYLGIFGYLYGSIPPRQDKSITHLEFLWALERWSELRAGPVAVFMPQGRLEKALRTTARRLLRKEVKNQPEAKRVAEEVEHERRVARFHAEVLVQDGEWRFINHFDSVQRLREQAIAVCKTWQGKIFEDAYRAVSAPDSGRRVSDPELGRLHARPLAVLTRLLARAAGRPELPALGLLVAGGEDAGQLEFLALLQEFKPLRAGRRPGVARPLQDPYDLPTFVRACAQALGFVAADTPPLETVDALAERIHQELKHQQLVLLVNQVERFPGKVAGFQARFWAPLVAALQALRAVHPEAHRLVMVAVDYTGRADTWTAAVVTPDDAAPDPLRLVQLPPLKELDRDDLLTWLAEVEVPDDPPGRHAKLAARVLANPQGETDCTPIRVFSRLRNESLWPDADLP